MELNTDLLAGCFLLLFVSQAYAQSSPTPSEKAQVTFYSGGKTIFGKPKSDGTFFYKIFDGNNELALLERHRFVTFALKPGIHVLSSNVWMSNHPGGDSRITISLAANHRYFINTAFEATNWLGGMRLIFRKRRVKMRLC